MGGGMDHGGETVFFVFSFTLSNRMRVINYQPSSPTARKYPGARRGNAEQLKIPVGLCFLCVFRLYLLSSE